MFEPGYYKTNYRALRLREMVRWYGWLRGVREWLKTRFMSPSQYGNWMPRLWAKQECKPEDLSPDFWQATKPHRADFEKLDFTQCHLGKGTKKYDKLFDPLSGIRAVFFISTPLAAILDSCSTFGVLGSRNAKKSTLSALHLLPHSKIGR